MSRSVDRIFAVLFAALLVAPLLQMITHLVREPSVEERRQPRSIAAPLRRLVAMDPTLSNDVNGWFNDRYGFRSSLIRLHNEIDYQLYGVSDKVLIGRDGWLFEKDFVNDVVDDARKVGLEDRIIGSLRSLRDCLAQRGVKLVFVLNATKSSIYPQFLPTKLPVDPPTRLSRRLAAALKREPGIALVDGEQILSQHDDDELFYKTDVHMNLKGSSYVYREMVSRIAQLIGRPEPNIAPELWSIVKWTGGSEARFIAKFLPLANFSYVTSQTNSAYKSDEYGTYEWNVGSAKLPDHPDLPLFDLVYKNRRPQSTLLPPIMLFGTSFSDGFFTLKYDAAFAAVYQTRSNVPERIGLLLRLLPDNVKVFVLEFPEMFLSLIPRMGAACH